MHPSFNIRASIVFAICLLCSAGAALPRAHAAERGKAGTPPISWEKCGDIDDVAEVMHGELSERTDRLLAARHEERGILAQERMASDSDRVQARLRADEIRALQFSTLAAHAASSKARVAIAAFQAAVTDAVRMHRFAADRAIADFRSDLDVEIAAHTARIDSARTALLQNLNAGLARSKSICGTEGRPVRSRDDLRTTVQSVRGKFLDEVRAANGSDIALKQVMDEKQAALMAAENTMRASLDAARIKLVQALEQ